MATSPMHNLARLLVATAALAVAIALNVQVTRAATVVSAKEASDMITPCQAIGCYGSGPVMCKAYVCGSLICSCGAPWP